MGSSDAKLFLIVKLSSSKALRRLLGAGLLAGAGALGALAAFTWSETRRVQRLVPPDGEFLEIRGARLHYVDRGRGQTIFMIHGLGGQLRNFNYLLDLLAREYRVVVVDRPGSGYSSRVPGGAANLRYQAALMAELMERLELSRPLVVGHSLGGAVALALALDFPELVGGLALVAPLTQLVEPNQLPASFRGLAIPSPALRTALAWTMVSPAARFGSPKPLADVFFPDPIPSDYGVRAGGLLARRPANFEATSLDLQAAATDLPDMMARYADLTIPVRILFGRQDTVLNPEVHGVGMLGALPGLRLDVVEGGHMLPVSAPESTAEWIAEAARELSGTP